MQENFLFQNCKEPLLSENLRTFPVTNMRDLQIREIFLLYSTQIRTMPPAPR